MKNNRLKNKLKTGILLLGIVLFTNCEKEHIYESPNNSAFADNEFEIFKQGFNAKLINQELLLGEDNLQVDWNGGDIINFSKSGNKTIYEFNAYLKNPITIESKLFYQKNIYKLIVIQKENQVQYKIIRFEPFEQSNNLNPTYRSIRNFSGNKYELNHLGRIELLETYDNGKIIGSLNLTKKSGGNSSSLSSKLPSDCDLITFHCGSPGGGSNRGSSGGSGSYVRQTTYHYTDWYKKVGNSWVYIRTQYNRKSTKWVYVRKNSDRGTNSHNVYTHRGPRKNPNIKPVRIFNNLTGKAACLNKVLTEKGNSYIQGLLSKFKGESKYDIKISSKNKLYHDGREVNGLTAFPKKKKGEINNIINIEISTTKANSRSALQVTRTILHEYIHADMYRKLNTDSQTKSDLDFRKTYEAYDSQIFRATPQHNTMADLYVGEMKKVLKSFHKTVLMGDYNYLSNNGTKSLDDLYEALAWQGLKIHDVEVWRTMPEGRKKVLNDALKNNVGSLTKTCPKNS